MKRFVISALVLCAACSATPDHVATVREFESLKNAGQEDATLELFSDEDAFV